MEAQQDSQTLEDMVADYMEKGFLENIIDMLKYDKETYKVIARLIKDERLRVRLGAIALVEEIKELGLNGLDELSDSLLPLLSDENPLVRADTAYCFELVGKEKHISTLEKHAQSEQNQQVKEALTEAVDEIRLS